MLAFLGMGLSNRNIPLPGAAESDLWWSPTPQPLPHADGHVRRRSGSKLAATPRLRCPCHAMPKFAASSARYRKKAGAGMQPLQARHANFPCDEPPRPPFPVPQSLYGQ
ncbi:Hypothetical predicted protein [Podarcis lilfordi]|uniref:Uncharacterized protein n=1 Tax=Podarcis lilfordi TaxID=74358 RepID=A0AA35P3T2_9SAUR|nr:Hypothetical predicted protein [Podarcis lilfordi]